MEVEVAVEAEARRRSDTAAAATLSPKVCTYAYATLFLYLYRCCDDSCARWELRTASLGLQVLQKARLSNQLEGWQRGSVRSSPIERRPC